MKKLEYLQSKEREVVENPNLSRSFGNKPTVNPKTPADKLLEQFDNHENSSYVALFAEMKSDQLTIKKKRKHKNNHSIAELTEEELKSVQDSTDSANIHASKIRESLRISNKVNKILLAFAWTDTDSKIRFDMFPSILVADCTHSLNKEERPVMIFAGIDSHNATHSHTWVFLPSEARWVFSWVLNSALPQLHNRNTLARARLFVTDQDGQLNFVADNSLGPGSKFPWDIHRVCAWHKLDWNLTNAPRFQGALASNQHDDSAMAEWNALVTWLWALVKTPESEWETNVLTTLLDLYLQEGHTKGQLTDELKELLRDFIATSFMGNQGKLLGHNYHSVMTCGKVTSSIVEVENLALKRGFNAPGPQDNIHSAQVKMAQKRAKRNLEKKEKP
jgi:MULE transposase domain